MEMKGRIYKEQVDIDPDNVRRFFDERAKKQLPHRYNYSIYQDDHPELALQRDQYEKEYINGEVSFRENATVLDVGCGVGRWADFFAEKGIKRYVGTDISYDTLEIARKHFEGKSDVIHFVEGALQDTGEVLAKNDLPGKYDYVLVNGVFLYINDAEMEDALTCIRELTGDNGMIYIKDAIATGDRLTLKDFESNELKSDYNAVYRTISQWNEWMERVFLSQGFDIQREGPIWPQDMQNRSETMQYHWIIRNG